MIWSETTERCELAGTLRGLSPLRFGALRHELGWTHYRILMREDDLTQPRKTLSELRKRLQSAGFANAETLVPRQGVGRGVVYAFCEMHNKCTKCTTDILRNKSQMRKMARKTGGGASSQHANAGVHTTQKGSQETTEKTTQQTTLQGNALAIVELIKRNPEVKISEIAEHVVLTRNGVNYRIRQLKKLIGLRHDSSDKNGRWVIGA